MATPQPVRVFIGSSSEGAEVAHRLQALLEARGGCEVDIWDQAFAPSGYAIDSLLEVAERCDFAVLIASPDDETVSRGQTTSSIRDNIVLELGLFIGALGRNRTYLLATDSVKLPSDVFGLTRLPYHRRVDGKIASAVNPAALAIKDQIDKLGPRTPPANGLTPRGVFPAPALEQELELLRDNAVAQGWTVKTDTPPGVPRSQIHACHDQARHPGNAGAAARVRGRATRPRPSGEQRDQESGR